MRRLVPTVAEEPLEGVYEDLALPTHAEGFWRPSVTVNMVASVDGAVAVDGRSGALGGPADRVAFPRLRDACDAILVGAGTVRAEDYGPGRGTEARRLARRTAGLTAVPTLVIVTSALDLDPDARVFRTRPGDPRPIVLTDEAAPEDRAARLAEVAEVRRHGRERVDLVAALERLRADGVRRILSEGGPTLNGSLLAHDLVDEVFLTVSPLLVGGDAGRVAIGPPLAGPRRLELLELREHQGELLSRWRVVRPAG